MWMTAETNAAIEGAFSHGDMQAWTILAGTTVV